MPARIAATAVAGALLVALATTAAEAVTFAPDVPTLAANTLRIYVHFDRPMRTDAVDGHVELRDETGRLIDAPFFAGGPELWSPDGTRLTLLFDPGRVKSGLAAHDRLGRALRPGGAVRLVVRGTLPGADGRPLGYTASRRWTVGPPDTRRVDPARWTITAPRAGTVEPLVVRLDAPVDRLLLESGAALLDPDGALVSGPVTVSAAGDRWRLTPARPWAAGRHTLLVESTLEDHAGNSLAGRFDRPADEPLRIFPGGVYRRPVPIGGRGAEAAALGLSAGTDRSPGPPRCR